MAQLAVGISLLASAIAIVCVALGEELVARPAMYVALIAGIVATFLAAARGLASRVLGYAIAAMLLAAVAFVAASLLPDDWREPHMPNPSAHSDRRLPT